MEHHNLLMGQLYASARRCSISTVLGSCIAICLWDTQKGLGGMNHFMLPQWDGRAPRSPRFGDVAIEALIDAVIEVGGRRSAFVAKVFGGGNVLGQGEPPAQFNIGARNTAFALHALEQADIPVVAAHLRPSRGLKIMFDTACGEVLLRSLKPPPRAEL
jgi:chemotaxis protein CheD